MALALGMYKGNIVQIGKVFWKVTGVLGPEQFILARCSMVGKDLSEKMTVTAEKSVELNNKAYVSAGIGTHGMARVVIDAPREIGITRIKNVDNTERSC